LKKMDALHTHFQNIHSLIQQGKTRALAAATAYSLESYWNVGAYLSQRLNEKTYNKKVVPQLAEWLQRQEPGLKGFDRRSLYRMREFFEHWESMDWSIAELDKNKNIKLSIDVYEEKKIVGLATPQLPPVPLVLTRIT